MDTIWQARHAPLGAGGWQAWFRLGLQLVARDALFLWTVYAAWRDRARQRHILRSLDARALADIGLTSADVAREVAKPFWRP